ncbi:MAG: penicillin-binding protein 1C [Verrucomicrobiales bacterium]|nr:penicillin-binding protein 1C [Verrucomicrobiales bacterium]
MKRIHLITRHLFRAGLSLKAKIALSLLGVFSIATWLCLSIAPLFFELPEALLSDPQAGKLFTDRTGHSLRRLLNADLAIDTPATLDEIPQHLIEATIAVEDSRFYQHRGTDSLAIARAATNSLRARRMVSGASTISQQLIKLTSPAKTRSLGNKITEALTARHLEKQWDKNKILSAYLNRLPYGNLLTGCRAAARGYFNKPLADLSLAECSLLAGLPNRPSYFNPRQSMDKAKKRQAWVLQRMLLSHKITHEQYQHALQQKIQLHHSGGLTFQAPHLVDLILSQTESKLPNSQAPSSPIRTSIDLETQQLIEQTINNHLQQLEQDRPHASALQAAAVVIDNRSGEVLSLVGSRDYFNSNSGQINGAWIARSPGSALKPFTYLIALERSNSAATLLDDLPLEFMTSSGSYRPVNYDRTFRGPVTYREALATSLNVPAIRLLNQLGGPEVLQSKLTQLGISTLKQAPSHYGLGLTIGTAEVRLLELTNAYACLARLGRYAPYRLTSPDATADSHTDVPIPSTQLFSADACYLIADMLSDPTARAPAFGLNSPLNLPFKVACKTGTSTDFRDNWTIGYTPKSTVGVWVGCFDNQAMPKLSGAVGAGPIFHDIFTQLYSKSDDPPSWYARPQNIVAVRIDPLNGKRLAESDSPSPAAAPHHSRLEIFRQNNLPPIALPSDYDAKGRTLLPARYHTWFTNSPHQLHQRAAITPLNQTLQPNSSSDFLILSPLPHTVVYLDQDLPNQGSLFMLKTNSPYSSIRWSCPTLQIQHPTDADASVTLELGTHQLTAIDAKHGSRTSVTIRVESL